MEKKSYTTIGFLIAVLAVLMFSSKAIIVKLVYQYHIAALHMLLIRMIFAMPFYVGVLGYLYQKKQLVSLTKKEVGWIMLLGTLGYYVASFFDFVGLQFLPASLERIILFIYPTIVVILGAVFLKQKVTRKQLLAIATTYAGVLIIFSTGNLLGSQPMYLKGVFFILMSAFTYAAYLVGSGWMIPKLGVLQFTAMAMLVACIVIILHYGLFDRLPLLNYPKEVYGWVLVMTIFCTVIPSFLVSFAIEKLGSATFSIIGGIGPVFTIILAYLFLGEAISLVQILGAAIVIVGVKLVSKSS